MKTIFKIMMMAALTMVWGCSSDHDDDDNGITNPEEEKSQTTDFVAQERPTWEIDWTWNDEPPVWDTPDPSLYEDRMYFIIQLESRYNPYSSVGDCMAAFINGECRGVGVRNVSTTGDHIFFAIMVFGNYKIDKDYPLTFQYYCSGIKQIFTPISFQGGKTFAPDAVLGSDYNVVLYFGSGSTKYPYPRDFVMVTLAGDIPFTPSENDMVGAFVGDECRARAKYDDAFCIWLRDPSEQVQFRYYSEEKGGVYIFKKLYSFENEKFEQPILTF